MTSDIEVWLDGHGVQDSWDLAPALVDLGYDAERLQQLADTFEPNQIPTVVAWLSTFHTVHHLLSVVMGGADRLSAIVKALKSYAYLDQAPVQTVNLHEGLDESLLILRHKLRGISVRREYDPDVLSIEAYGAELNQVWTNLLDNAADALGETGQIIIRTRLELDSVVVEIEDNGPGIPENIQRRIFDPFFTTKPPGKGTGLGLKITYNIVAYKHRGTVTVEPKLGRTCFRVTLPTKPRSELPG